MCSSQVWELWKEGQCMDIVDKPMDKTYSEKMVSRCIQTGLLCVQRYALDQPCPQWFSCWGTPMWYFHQNSPHSHKRVTTMEIFSQHVTEHVLLAGCDVGLPNLQICVWCWTSFWSKSCWCHWQWNVALACCKVWRTGANSSSPLW